MITPDDNGYGRVKRWREKHRGLANLRQREYRKGKKSGLGEKEAAVESNRSRTEMASGEILGSGVEGHAQSVRDHESENQRGSNGGETGNPTPSENQASPAPFTTKKVGEFRMVVLPEEKAPVDNPVSVETRSAKDVVGGIYRNDNGGVISKFAYEKLQRMKQHAKEHEFEIDEYSQ